MKVFLDANIILDLVDLDRGNFEKTKVKIASYIANDAKLFTSCDIFTTVFYIASKKIYYQEVIDELQKILNFVEVIPIDIEIINKAMMISKYKKVSDLEDVLQFVCAKEVGCSLIVTNDKDFYSDGIDVENIC